MHVRDDVELFFCSKMACLSESRASEMKVSVKWEVNRALKSLIWCFAHEKIAVPMPFAVAFGSSASRIGIEEG